jgi:hypothetical protein
MRRVWPRIMPRSGRRFAHSRQLTSGTTTRSDQATAPGNERFAGRKRRRVTARTRRITGRSGFLVSLALRRGPLRSDPAAQR